MADYFMNNPFTRRFSIRQLQKLDKIVKKQSLTEKSLLVVLLIILTTSTIWMLQKINENFLIEIPTHGGHLTEGIVGTPRFINPLLAISNADRDLTTLVYSGLMKATPGGNLIPDLAEKYEVSESGLSYTFTLKDNLVFHDNTPITTADIEYTISLSQNSVIKSSKRANWDGVGIEIINEKEIKFILQTPYSPFLENTTIGILPKHIWENIEPEQFAFSNFNIEPIGSGPYKITQIDRNSDGILEQYTLKAFKKYALNEPYITDLTIKLFPNEERLVAAFKKESIESINTLPAETIKNLKEEKEVRTENVSLPRIFGVFFNQNQNEIFTNIEVRKALNHAINKERIIENVLGGYGESIFGPIPKNSKYFDRDSEEIVFNLEEAKNIMDRNGWNLNKEGVWENKKGVPLIFTITTSDADDLKITAELIKEDWERLGAKVNINIFEIGDLNQNVIRPREYEALLFGEIIGRDMDLFAFWHSSQRNDPGLNIALYTNITTDKLLEDVRTTNNEEERVESFKEFQREIAKDIPAIFIYSPNFTYIIPEKIRNFSLGQITLPSERFLGIHRWNIETEKVWGLFTN